MGVRSYEPREDPRPVRRGPAVLALCLVVGLVLAGLLVNGRPGVGEGTPTFASALGATGAALLGKLAASLGAAVAAGFLFLAVGLRRPQDDARTAALLLAFGTTLWAVAQSFSATPFSTALVAAALWLLVKAEDDPAQGPRAGLPVGFAVALQPADLALALVLALFAVLRRPRQIGLWALWSAPGLALAVGLATTGAMPWAFRFDADWAPRLAALWLAPAVGLLVFAPVVLVGLTGLLVALRSVNLPLAASCMAAFLAHGLVIAARSLAGGTWGPRDWTDALPLALLFLPEGLDRLRSAGTVLALLSVAVQVLGAFTYEGRWDRLFAATPEKRAAALWDAARSPIPFAVGERVVIAALPQVQQGGIRIAEHRVVLGGSEGSRISATASRLAVAGADPTLGHVHLLGGALVEGDLIRLEAPGDAVFFRVRPGSRGRRLEVRISGRGQGSLAVEEATFWSPEPHSRTHATAGAFRWKVPYYYPESGGGDVRISLRSGSVAFSSVSLVPPTEPENVIRLQGAPDR